jgi:threonine/homoserine/homoserine lactone efflux protein
MEIPLLLRGIILGVGIAAPVGPIGLLCIQRTLSHGRRIGLASGLGAASADAFYGVVAAFGLTLITAFLVEQQLWLGVGGGLFLAYLGVRTLLALPAEMAGSTESSGGIGRAWGSTFLLTLTNPMTILAFVAIFAGAGMSASGGGAEAVLLVVGVFLGSALWWTLLTTGVALARGRMTPRLMVWINRSAGVLILAFAAYALLSVLGG